MDLLLLLRNNFGLTSIVGHNLLVCEAVVEPLLAFLITFLVYKLLSRLAKHALLRPVLLVVLLVAETFLRNCSEHAFALTIAVEPLHLLLLLL